MKDLKIPIGWLVPIIGVILLLGWFLGRSGWNVTEVDTGVAKLAPPTATSHQEPLQPTQGVTQQPPITQPTDSVATQPTSAPVEAAPVTTQATRPAGQITTAPTLTPVSPTVPGTTLKNGETWYVEGWSLTVSNFTYKTLNSIHFILRNRTGRTVLFPEIDPRKFKIVSDADDELYACRRGPSWPVIAQTELSPGEKIEWDWGFYPLDYWGSIGTCHEGYPRFSPDAKTLTLIIENIADVIVNARWQTEIPRP